MSHFQCRLLGGVTLLGRASGYASFMVQSARCPSGSNAVTLDVGENIMNSNVVSSTARTMAIYRGSTEVTDLTFTANDTLTVELSSTSGQYVFEISGGM